MLLLLFSITLLIIFLFLSIMLFRQLFRFSSSVRSSVAGGDFRNAVTLQSTEAGLDPAIIASIPLFRYAEVRRLMEGRHQAECMVCLSDFAADDAVRLLTVCSHAFHQGCIDSWLFSHMTCPICRSNVEEVPNEATVTVLREVVARDDSSGGDDGDNRVVSMHGAGELAEGE